MKTKQQVIHCSPVACLNKKVKLCYVTLAAICGLRIVHNLKDAGQRKAVSKRCQRQLASSRHTHCLVSKFAGINTGPFLCMGVREKKNIFMVNAPQTLVTLRLRSPHRFHANDTWEERLSRYELVAFKKAITFRDSSPKSVGCISHYAVFYLIDTQTKPSVCSEIH
jgi:hypothetical protein